MIKWFCVLGLMAGTPLFISAQAPATPVPSAYQIDHAVIRDIGKDLYQSLTRSERAPLSPNPIWIKEDARFYTRPFRFESENVPTRIVYFSTGFLKLANSVAHAKAVDRIEPGFFSKYISSFKTDTNSIQVELPAIFDPRYWTENVMNEQASYLNQILGVVAAIDLAHHYLGHYEKYGSRLRDSAIDPTTMAGLCSVDQWRTALERGAANALDCGFGFEGIKAFYDCIEGLEIRAPWTIYFLPVKVNVAEIKKELDATEGRFFGQ